MPRTGRDDPGMAIYLRGREFEIWPLGRLFSPVPDAGLFVQNTIPGDSVRDGTQFWSTSSRVRLLCHRRRLEEKGYQCSEHSDVFPTSCSTLAAAWRARVLDAVGKQISCTVISIINLLLYQTTILSAEKRSLYDGLTVTCGVIMRRAERVGFGLWGESCSIFFSREAGKYKYNRKNICTKTCNFKPLSHHKTLATNSAQFPSRFLGSTDLLKGHPAVARSTNIYMEKQMKNPTPNSRLHSADGDAIQGPCITSRAASFKCSFKAVADGRGRKIAQYSYPAGRFRPSASRVVFSLRSGGRRGLYCLSCACMAFDKCGRLDLLHVPNLIPKGSLCGGVLLAICGSRLGVAAVEDHRNIWRRRQRPSPWRRGVLMLGVSLFVMMRATRGSRTCFGLRTWWHIDYDWRRRRRRKLRRLWWSGFRKTEGVAPVDH